MSDYKLKLENLTQTFGRRLIFNDVNFEFESGKIFGLEGRNGSGKSTLAKIISGIITPTRGKVIHSIGGKAIKEDDLHKHIGFVSPYLVLYDEFSAEENLMHFAKIRGLKFDSDWSKELFELFGIYDRRNDLLKGYSSGMKQRIKFIFAMYHKPRLLLFDEPTSNLDQAGKDVVYNVIKEKSKNDLVIVASNEESDLALCSQTLKVEEFKKL